VIRRLNVSVSDGSEKPVDYEAPLNVMPDSGKSGVKLLST
jgi:hypothetical protein